MPSRDDSLSDRFDVIGDEPRSHLFSAELLSTVPDHELQKLVESAARVAGTPIALVTMLTDHLQLFRAHTGVPEGVALATDRDVSFCQNVVAQDAPFETHDAAHDPRVPQHMVKTMGLAAYLGVPLRSHQGTLGTLCVIDVEPRDFTDTQRDELARLAALVERRLDQLRSARRLSQSTEPVFAELRNLLTPMMMSIDTLDVSLAEVQMFQGFNAKPSILEADPHLIHKSREALSDLVDEVRVLTQQFDELITNIDALQDATCDSGMSCKLERVLTTVQTLTHHLTKVTGGLLLGASPDDVTLSASLSEVTTMLSVVINTSARRMLNESRTVAVTLSAELDPDGMVHFDIHSPDYTPEDLVAIQHETLDVMPSNSWRTSTPRPDGIRLSVPTVEE